MESGQGFGVVGLMSGSEVRAEASVEAEFFQAGCRVQIEDWDQLQNGLLGISVLADKRFLIRSTYQQEDGLWMAEVDWLEDRLPDNEPQPDLGSDYQGLIDLYHSLAKHSGEALSPTEDVALLGWAIASLLPIGNADFAELLAENNPLERLRLLAEKIDRLAMK